MIVIKNTKFLMFAILEKDSEEWKYLPYAMLDVYSGILPSKVKGMVELQDLNDFLKS